MKIGLIDHIGQSGSNLARLFDERIQFYSEADRLGYYCFHLAEHHCSPLNMAPSPSIFLAALARETKNLRLGPLCYLLTLYTPLRIHEEICMLDNISHGRLEAGIGRGVSPFELNYHNVDHSKSRDIFIEAYECLKQALNSKELTYESDHYSYKNAPIELNPYQKNIPFWYGSSNTIGATWAGEHGLNFTAIGPTLFAKTNIDAFKKALNQRGGPVLFRDEFSGGVAIGTLRNIVVAETDAEAIAIAEPAAMKLHEQLNWMRNRHGVTEHASRLNVPRAQSFEGMLEDGSVIAGSPSTVLEKILQQTEIMGTNYILAYMMFGDMTLKQGLTSLKLFSSEIMPTLNKM
jgi:alkanesulfonate monooxygenase SsuD/methylene tetrahydromethanopterin reductase-like flavin-dependent oxidoreductase (luciferase family)